MENFKSSDKCSTFYILDNLDKAFPNTTSESSEISDKSIPKSFLS